MKNNYPRLITRILPTAELSREMDYLTGLDATIRLADTANFVLKHWWDFRRVLPPKYDDAERMYRSAYEDARREYDKTWETYRRARWAYAELHMLTTPCDIRTPKSFSIGYDNFVQVTTTAGMFDVYYSAHRLLSSGRAIEFAEHKTTTWGEYIKHEKANAPYKYIVTQIGRWLLSHPTRIEQFLIDHDHEHETINRLWNVDWSNTEVREANND